MAARAAADQRRRRSGPQGRDGGLAVARLPGRAREPVARAARRVSAPRGVRLPLSDEIAEIVGTSEQNARQLATRARRHVQQRRPRFEASRQQREQIATRFFAAAEEGDLQGLRELLAHDVVLHGDGGGKAPAIARALHGRSQVARALTRGFARLKTPARRLQRTPRGDQRPTGRAVLRPRRPTGQRDHPRRRRRSDPSRELDRQPRQAAAPRTGRRRQIALRSTR